MRTILLSLGIVVFCFSTYAWGKIGGGDIRYKVIGAGEVIFTHDSHVNKARGKCTECHYRLYTTVQQHNKTTMAEMQQGKSCGACHDGRKSFDVKANCERCHAK